MKRPIIKNQKVIKYVDHLEDKLKAYESDTTLVRLYLAIKTQVDDISEILLANEIMTGAGEEGIKKVKLMNLDAMTDKDDKLFDRYFKFMEKAKHFAEQLIFLESRVNPEILLTEEGKLSKNTSVESQVFTGDGQS